ncbi:uncharacterized protein LOC128893886 [Hylaeus anthracinus]|uniref:uncharacterized protein LOC128893886 n=1 Tax=Hylaeus anthracinus TaxID=313031 RepID=UPI0023B8A81F|nr:uncharacterized protein LOC128893886 [Hylaeus anthracinus]
MMCSNYFEKITFQARQLDDGIEKLTETWRRPQVIIGRFAECTEETNSHIEAVWNIIKNTQGGIQKILSERKEFESLNSVSMEQFLKETKQTYELLKEQSDSLETVLAEYGYHYENDSSKKISMNNSSMSNEYISNDMKHLQVEVTPNIDSHYKAKREYLTTLSSNGSYISQSLATPVDNNLTLFSASTPMTNKDYTCTSFRERPEEPIYSTHFYNILKK